MSLASILLVITVVVYYSMGGSRANIEADDGFCYANTEDPYLYFSSKTSYSLASNFKNNVTTVIPNECKPVQLWMVIRHGARFAVTKKMEAFHDLIKLRHHIVSNHYKHNRGELCEKDLHNLKAWSMDNIPLSKSDQLTQQGYIELKDLGSRIWTKFNNLFKHSYSRQMYKVQYTNHDKTRDSAKAFTIGLFGQQVDIPESTPQDLLARIYPDCEVLPIPGANDPSDKGKDERSLFKSGPVMKKLIKDVSRRLGFKHSLKIDDVDIMYDMCRYKKSWAFEELSPWCACFTEEDLKVLEYMGDISYYYNSGHGYSGNLRTGCPLVQDMYFRFRDVVTNEYNDQPSAVFYFGHSTTIYNLFARLNLAKDNTPLKHDNYFNGRDRKWRTSLIGPFSANFAAVLLECDGDTKYSAVFYHNELPLKFDECNGYICSWETLQYLFESFTDPLTCNFDFCEKSQEQDEIQDKNITAIVESKSHANLGSQRHENLLTMPVIDNISDVKSQIITEVYTKTDEAKNQESNKILSRKFYDLSDSQEKNEVIAEEEITKDKGSLQNIVAPEIKFDKYKRKPYFTNREINLSWLFISFIVGIVVLGLCCHYMKKRKHLRSTKISYERMSSPNFLQLRNFT